MEALTKRVDRIETSLDAIQRDLQAVQVKMGEVSGKLDVLTGQVIGKLPGWWQMPAVMAGTVVFLITFGTAAIGVAKWLKLLPT